MQCNVCMLAPIPLKVSQLYLCFCSSVMANCIVAGFTTDCRGFPNFGETCSLLRFSILDWIRSRSAYSCALERDVRTEADLYCRIRGLLANSNPLRIGRKCQHVNRISVSPGIFRECEYYQRWWNDQ